MTTHKQGSACVACRRACRGCDRMRPSCQRCLSRGLTCGYPDRFRFCGVASRGRWKQMDAGGSQVMSTDAGAGARSESSRVTRSTTTQEFQTENQDQPEDQSEDRSEHQAQGQTKEPPPPRTRRSRRQQRREQAQGGKRTSLREQKQAKRRKQTQDGERNLREPESTAPDGEDTAANATNTITSTAATEASTVISTPMSSVSEQIAQQETDTAAAAEEEQAATVAAAAAATAAGLSEEAGTAAALQDDDPMLLLPLEHSLGTFTSDLSVHGNLLPLPLALSPPALGSSNRFHPSEALSWASVSVPDTPYTESELETLLLQERTHELLSYYDRVICPHQIVLPSDGITNPYRQYILPLAYEHAPLLFAVLGLAACHQAMQKDPPDNHNVEAVQYQLRAIRSLVQLIECREAILGDRDEQDALLAAIQILVLHDICESGVSRHGAHINGSAGLSQLLLESGRITADHPRTVFFVANLAWLDIIRAFAGVSRLCYRQSLLQAVAAASDRRFERVNGCPRTLFLVVGEVLWAAAEAEDEAAGQPRGRHSSAKGPDRGLHSRNRPTASHHSFNSGYNDSGSVSLSANSSSSSPPSRNIDSRSDNSASTSDAYLTPFQRKADHALHILRHWKPRPDTFPDMTAQDQIEGSCGSEEHSIYWPLIGEAFRHALILKVLRLRDPLRPAGDPDIQYHVKAVLDATAGVPRESPLLELLIMPLFMGGTDAINAHSQFYVRSRIDEIRQRSGFANPAPDDILRKLWTAREAKGDPASSENIPWSIFTNTDGMSRQHDYIII